MTLAFVLSPIKVLNGLKKFIIFQVPKLGENETSKHKVKNENIEAPVEDTGRPSSAEVDFKKEVIKGIDTDVFVVDKQEADTTYVEYNTKIQSEIKPDDDSVEDVVDEQETIQTTSSSIAFQVLATELEKEVQLFHSEVASEVKATLNLYYPEAKEFVGEARMRSREQYKQVARQLSHHLRERIKESYRVLHGASKT